MTITPLAAVPIAGWKHYINEAFVNKFLAGDVVKLLSEPTNEFDDKAVEVFWQDKDRVLHKVGYVPRTLNKDIFTRISAGEDIQARIVSDFKPKITIFLEKEDEGHE